MLGASRRMVLSELPRLRSGHLSSDPMKSRGASHPRNTAGLRDGTGAPIICDKGTGTAVAPMKKTRGLSRLVRPRTSFHLEKFRREARVDETPNPRNKTRGADAEISACAPRARLCGFVILGFCGDFVHVQGTIVHQVAGDYHFLSEVLVAIDRILILNRDDLFVPVVHENPGRALGPSCTSLAQVLCAAFAPFTPQALSLIQPVHVIVLVSAMVARLSVAQIVRAHPTC